MELHNILKRIFSALECFVVAANISYCLQQSTWAVSLWCEKCYINSVHSTYSFTLWNEVVSFEQDTSIFLIWGIKMFNKLWKACVMWTLLMNTRADLKSEQEFCKHSVNVENFTLLVSNAFLQLWPFLLVLLVQRSACDTLLRRVSQGLCGALVLPSDRLGFWFLRETLPLCSLTFLTWFNTVQSSIKRWC